MKQRIPIARSTGGGFFKSCEQALVVNFTMDVKEGDDQPRGKITFFCLFLHLLLSVSITYDGILRGYSKHQDQSQGRALAIIMGKEQHKVQGSKTYVLKFDMHCQCNGCVKKISEGVKEISLSDGVERADVSVETGEVEVTGRMDPEKLCCLLHEATKKCVKIVGQTEGIPVGETKNLFDQAPPATAPPEARDDSSNTWWNRRGTATLHAVAPSAPPLPEEYKDDGAWRSKAVASERCRYRWSAPSCSPGVWAASDVTGTLAMYEL